MPTTMEPDGLGKPRLELSERLTEVMRRELPSLAEEIVSEIRDTIPEYARPLDGPYGRTLRSGVERALNGFLTWVNSPNAPLDEICRKLGEFEAYEGRQLDTLQSAYRVGAQTSWRRVMALHRRHDLQPATVSVLADALFAYMEEMASLSQAGYLEAKARSNPELEAGRRRLLRLILEGPAAGRDLVAEYAERAGWAVPERVTLVALQPGAPIIRTFLDDDLLADLDGAEPHLLLPGPLTPERRAMLEFAVAESRAAAGLTVPLARAADSLRWARQALGLIHSAIVEDGPLTLCEDHLVTLWLASDGPLIDQIARRQLAKMGHLTERQRERLTETLRVWLCTRGTAAQVGEDLGVHPQTVRYRMRQIEQILGDDLVDPDARFALEVVMRALWLRDRATPRKAADRA
jgi:PucR C-terminal helix-turn-helix domain